MAEEAEDAETVVDGHEYHASLSPGFAVHGHLVAPAVGICPAVNPYRHGQLLPGMRSGVPGRPYVEIEAVLAELGVTLPIELLGVEGLGVGMGRLDRSRAEGVADAHRVPRGDGLGLLPAQLSHGRGGIRYSPEDEGVAVFGKYSLHLSAFDADHGGGAIPRSAAGSHHRCGRYRHQEFAFHYSDPFVVHRPWLRGRPGRACGSAFAGFSGLRPALSDLKFTKKNDESVLGRQEFAEIIFYLRPGTCERYHSGSY